MGTPGGIAPVPAAPVSAGADRVRLTLSGQVNRMLLYGNDGRASAVRNVDNNNSSTRFRQRGSAMAPVSGTKFVFSPAGAYGPAVASVFSAMDGLSRDDRIRYDTPRFAGFQFMSGT